MGQSAMRTDSKNVGRTGLTPEQVTADSEVQRYLGTRSAANQMRVTKSECHEGSIPNEHEDRLAV